MNDDVGPGHTEGPYSASDIAAINSADAACTVAEAEHRESRNVRQIFQRTGVGGVSLKEAERQEEATAARVRTAEEGFEALF